MEFTIYCHEIMSGSDVGMHFSATLEEAIAAANDTEMLFDGSIRTANRLELYVFTRWCCEFPTSRR